MYFYVDFLLCLSGGGRMQGAGFQRFRKNVRLAPTLVCSFRGSHSETYWKSPTVWSCVFYINSSLRSFLWGLNLGLELPSPGLSTGATWQHWKTLSILCVCVYTICMQKPMGARKGCKLTWNSSYWRWLSLRVGAGNQTQILCKNQCS